LYQGFGISGKSVMEGKEAVELYKELGSETLAEAVSVFCGGGFLLQNTKPIITSMAPYPLVNMLTW
jgi:hypothetical protein